MADMKTTRFFSLVAFAITLFALAPAQLSARDYYELRTYRLVSEEKAKLFDETFGPTMVEALEAAGVGPVGVFKPIETEKTDKVEVLRYVLAPYKTIEEWATLDERLKENGEIWEGALDFLFNEKSDPNYTRIDSMLLLAFEGMPALKMPEKPKDKEGRHFEFRTYESHNHIKGGLKVEMFNKGEIELFDEVGLNAVFYGEAKVAKNLPQLTYMLVYDSEEARKKAWKTFLESPKWKVMKSDKRYKDTVSKIDSSFVKATKYSQIQ